MLLACNILLSYVILLLFITKIILFFYVAIDPLPYNIDFHYAVVCHYFYQ